MKSKKDFGFIFWLHLTLIILAYLSPILFNWKLILFGVIILFLQELIFQGCFLTHAQFGKDRYMTFYYRYLILMGFKPNKEKLKFLMAWIMPLIVLDLSLILQILLKFRPLIF